MNSAVLAALTPEDPKRKNEKPAPPPEPEKRHWLAQLLDGLALCWFIGMLLLFGGVFLWGALSFILSKIF